MREGGREGISEGGREGRNSGVCMWSLCKARFSEQSDVCNVFAEHFDQLILDYIGYVYLQMRAEG